MIEIPTQSLVPILFLIGFKLKLSVSSVSSVSLNGIVFISVIHSYHGMNILIPEQIMDIGTDHRIQQ